MKSDCAAAYMLRPSACRKSAHNVCSHTIFDEQVPSECHLYEFGCQKSFNDERNYCWTMEKSQGSDMFEF